MSEEQVVQPEQKPLEIEVDPQVAFNLKLQEFDKAITAAKAQAANLEMQKAAFIYDRNVQTLTEAHLAKKNEAIVDGEATPVVESK
jgi:hypothetical protein